MFVLITVLSLLSSVSWGISSTITLAKNQSFKFFIPSESKFQLVIRPSQFSHLLVQLDSCRLGFIKATNMSDSTNIPPASLYQFTYVYNITNDPVRVTIDYTTTNLSSYLLVYGFEDFSKLPSSSRSVFAVWTDQYLRISFDPLSIYSTVIECNYTIQFYSDSSAYRCRFNDTPHVAGEIIIPSQISNNLTFIDIDIPLNSQYVSNNTVSHSFNRLSGIQELMNSGQRFEVQVYAQITKPVVYDTNYIRTKVEPQTTLEALRNGFIILLVGVLVYGLISCIYLFCKRKYKNPNYFHEQTEPHPIDEGHQSPNTQVAGTADQLQN